MHHQINFVVTRCSVVCLVSPLLATFCVFKRPSDRFAATCQICKQCPTLPFVALRVPNMVVAAVTKSAEEKTPCRLGQLVRIHTLCVTWNQSLICVYIKLEYLSVVAAVLVKTL